LTVRGIGIAEGAAQRVAVKDDRLCGIELDGDRIVACDAVFVPPRFVPNSDLLAALGCDLSRTSCRARWQCWDLWVARSSSRASPYCSISSTQAVKGFRPSAPILSAENGIA
jgi:hypothetical protein